MTPFPDLPEGQTHSYGDGCNPPHEPVTELDKLKKEARDVFEKYGYNYPGSTGPTTEEVLYFLDRAYKLGVEDRRVTYRLEDGFGKGFKRSLLRGASILRGHATNKTDEIAAYIEKEANES